MGAGGTQSPCAPHRIYEPNAAATVRLPLVVFLPGTSGVPRDNDLILQTAAYAGYRTIGLSYDNTTSVESSCAASPSCASNCRALVREETVLGTPQTPAVNIRRGDSVVQRLYRALAQLDAQFPAGGWNDYYVPTAGLVTPTNIVWSKIILSGHSQGAGHAGWMSRRAAVHGLVLVDGGGETCVDGAGDPAPAEWTSLPDASAGRPKYGVTHTHGVPFVLPITWEALGLGSNTFLLDGGVPDVVDTAPPVPISWTDQGFPQGCTGHKSMAIDGCLPTDFAGMTAAATPDTSRLFAPYLNRFCHACDAATCP